MNRLVFVLSSVQKIGSCVVLQARGLIWVILRRRGKYLALISYAGFVMQYIYKISPVVCISDLNPSPSPGPSLP